MDANEQKSKDLAEKVRVFTEEYNRLFTLVRDLRTQQAELASKTLAEYESALPKMDAKIKEKTALLNDLDKQIADRYAELSKTVEDYSGRNKILEQGLNDLKLAINKHKEEVKADVQAIQELRNDATKFVDEKRRQLENLRIEIDAKKISMQQDQDAWKETKRTEELDLEQRKADMASFEHNTIERNEIAVRLQKQLTEERNKLQDLQTQAQVIINYKSTIDDDARTVNAKADQVVRDREQLNQLRVALRVKEKELNKLAEVLEDKQNRLDEREKNVRALEA